jgi:hypothetical protein
MYGISCGKCGQEWSFDDLHAVEGQTYNKVVQQFYGEGCQALGYSCLDPEDADTKRAYFSSVLMDLMGDDLDGVASELQDMEWLGIL